MVPENEYSVRINIRPPKEKALSFTITTMWKQIDIINYSCGIYISGDRLSVMSTYLRTNLQYDVNPHS